MIDGQGYRANVAMVLTNQSGQVFWARRIGGRGWQFPQGGMHCSESPEEAMYRELWEEVGLEADQVEILARTCGWLRYRLPDRYIRPQRPACVGQKQIWFLLRMLGDEGAICLDRSGEPEFDHWRWLDYWSPVEQIVDFKRDVYRRALQELQPVHAKAYGASSGHVAPCAGTGKASPNLT